MMNKNKAQELFGSALAKATPAASEIKDNFKPDEGTTGIRKFVSQFLNLWKSGAAGKCALIACALIVLSLTSCLFTGSGAKSDACAEGNDLADASDSSGAKAASSQSGKVPSIKGLRLGMSYDEALEACQKLCQSGQYLQVKTSEWSDHIKISVNQKTPDIPISGPDYCWVKVSGSKVYSICFTSHGIGTFFNSPDLKGEELGRLLVKNYPWIKSLSPEDEFFNNGTKTTWSYKSPDGYEFKLVEENMSCYDIHIYLYSIRSEASRKFD